MWHCPPLLFLARLRASLLCPRAAVCFFAAHLPLASWPLHCCMCTDSSHGAPSPAWSQTAARVQVTAVGKGAAAGGTGDWDDKPASEPWCEQEQHRKARSSRCAIRQLVTTLSWVAKSWRGHAEDSYTADVRAGQAAQRDSASLLQWQPCLLDSAWRAHFAASFRWHLLLLTGRTFPRCAGVGQRATRRRLAGHPRPPGGAAAARHVIWAAKLCP